MKEKGRFKNVHAISQNVSQSIQFFYSRDELFIYKKKQLWEIQYLRRGSISVAKIHLPDFVNADSSFRKFMLFTKITTFRRIV